MKTLYLIALLCLATMCRADVLLQQAADNVVTVKTTVYAAKIDAKGNLAELTVNGAPAFTHQFGNPGQPPAVVPSINVIGKMVAVRSGAMRVEWTFGEDVIAVLTEGYNFECTLDATVKSIVAPGGGGGALGVYNGWSTAIVLPNDLTVVAKNGMHVHERRYLPLAYTSGGVKPGTQVALEFRLGVPASAAQNLGSITLNPVGNDQTYLFAGGNTGQGLVHFADPRTIAFTITQQNFGKAPLLLEYRAVVQDHYVAGKEVASLRCNTTLPPDGVGNAQFHLPALAPGFYYVHVSAWRGATKLLDAKQTFTVNLAAYRPALTRPADFTAFWTKQLKQLQELPIQMELTQVSVPQNPNRCYAFSLAMPRDRKVQGYLVVPAQIRQTVTLLSGDITGRIQANIDAAKAEDWDPKTDMVTCFVGLPEDATFTRWTSAEDNNLFDCILTYVRAIDFLATRPEVKPTRIMVFGASRGGPLAFISAALRPKNVCGVHSMIPTSAGISWTDHPYYGWGIPNQYDPKNPEQVAALTKIAAYVDPVNHAPDVTAPFVLSYGVDDGLAQPQGIEAMYQLSPAPWKRISRDQGGHYYSDGFKRLQNELGTLLKAATQPNADDRILKEH